MSKKLLIVEESLRDLKAHWFAYVMTVASSAASLRYKVDVACNQKAVFANNEEVTFFPIFRYAYYLDLNKKKLPGESYYGFILHSMRALKDLWPFLSRQPSYEAIFVPTVLLHHLIAWWLILKFHPNRPKKTTLFFVTNPGVWDKKRGEATVPDSMRKRILGFLLNKFRKMVECGQVVLEVETLGAKKEFEYVSGIPFTLMPHPVPSKMFKISSGLNKKEPVFACYGFARYEKGSDILKEALCRYYSEKGNTGVRFIVQWLEPFMMPDGKKCDVGPELYDKTRVDIIDKPLNSEEYFKLLADTGCMVLPYRNSSYYARVSRIAIEAICMGIPLIYTLGGWLEEVAAEFGAGIGVKDEDVNCLVGAIVKMSEEYPKYRAQAMQNVQKAREYFSGENFCRILLENG